LPGQRPPATCGTETEEAPTPSSRKDNWLGVAVQQDFALVGSDADICSFDKQSSGTWTCFRASSTQYHGAPQRGVNDRPEGGRTLATTRVLVSYDRVLGANFTLGARLGYAFRGAPKPDGHDAVAFLPLHVEVRASYWFGADPFASSGVRPFVSLAAG